MDRALLTCFYTWGASVYLPVLGQALLDVLMEPPQPRDPSYAAMCAPQCRQGWGSPGWQSWREGPWS